MNIGDLYVYIVSDASMCFTAATTVIDFLRYGDVFIVLGSMEKWKNDFTKIMLKTRVVYVNDRVIETRTQHINLA